MMKKNFFIKTTVAVDAVRKCFGAKIQIVYLGVEDVLFKLRKCGLSGAQTSSRSKSNPEKKWNSVTPISRPEMKIQTKMTVGNRTQVLPKRNRRDTHYKNEALQKMGGKPEVKKPYFGEL